MTVNTAAETKFSIGPVADSTVDTISEFAALSWVEVGEVEDLGEFGDEAEEITFTALNDRRVRKLKGSFNAGSMTVVLGKDTGDAGQQALLAAFSTDFDYAVRIELNDKITTGGTNTFLYFRGKIMSKPTNVGDVSNVVRQTFTVGINSDILEDPAT